MGRLYSFLLALIPPHIRQERCPQRLVCNFRKCSAFQNNLSILFHGDKAVYYYDAEVILDAMCPHAKNNAPAMPRITHGHCSTLHVQPTCPWETRPPRLHASTSIAAVNVRTCLCLCDGLVYTPLPPVFFASNVAEKKKQKNGLSSEKNRRKVMSTMCSWTIRSLLRR